MSGFKDAVLDAAVTPDKIGRLFIVVIVAVFAGAVWIVNSEKEHADLRDAQVTNAQQISVNTAEFIALSSDVQSLTTEVKRDQELAEERRGVAAGDRARMERMLELLIESIQ